MSRTRTLLATAIATMTLGGVLAAPALAGYRVELSSDIDCDRTTGEWVVTYTIRSDNTLPAVATGTYTLVGTGSGETGELVFTPGSVSQGQPVTATERLPGSAAGTLTGSASLDGDVASDEVEDQLDGSCQATPASTTTTTTAPAEEPLPARPAFTG